MRSTQPWWRLAMSLLKGAAILYHDGIFTAQFGDGIPGFSLFVAEIVTQAIAIGTAFGDGMDKSCLTQFC